MRVQAESLPNPTFPGIPPPKLNAYPKSEKSFRFAENSQKTPNIFPGRPRARTPQHSLTTAAMESLAEL